MRSTALIAAFALAVLAPATPTPAQEPAGQLRLTIGDEQQNWYVMQEDGQTPRSEFQGSEDEGATVKLIAQPAPVVGDAQRNLTLEFELAPGVDRPRATRANLTMGGMQGPQEAQEVSLDIATVEYDALTLAVSGTLTATLGDRQIDGFFQATVDERTENVIEGAGTADEG